MKVSRPRTLALAALLLVGAAACATLRDVLQPPEFRSAEGRQAELRLLGPSTQRPLGGAAVRLYARVHNPNPLALTLSSLKGQFYLQDSRAADVDFPMGVPMPAGQDTVIPLDIALSFSDIPALADAARRWLAGQSVGYRLEGTVGVDAGALGQPTFGPSTLLQGQVAVTR